MACQLILVAVVYASSKSPTTLVEELVACSLGTQTSITTPNIGIYLSNNADVFATAMAACFIISYVWVFFLKSCTVLVVYISIMARVAIMVSVGFWFYSFSEGMIAFSILFFWFAFWYVVFLLWHCSEIATAVEVLKLAALSLIDRPSTLFSSMAICFGLFVYVVLIFYGIAYSYLIGEFVPPGCYFVTDSWSSTISGFLSVTWLWQLNTLQLVNLYSVCFNVAGW